MGRSDGRLVVLSYHSWEVSAETLAADIADVRRSGWGIVSAAEAVHSVANRSVSRARLAVITTDDGHAEDERFLDVMRATDTPAVTFITLGRIEESRRRWYSDRASDALLSIEDHGAWHRRIFVSSRLYSFVAPGAALGGFEYLKLPVGAPLFASAGEIADRRFVPDEEVVAAAVEAAGQSLSPAGSISWRADIQRALLARRMVRRGPGGLYARGRTESHEEYRVRVSDYLSSSRELFQRVLGRAPTLYAYTWWQGSRAADNSLRSLGYQGSFWGHGWAQSMDGRTFGMPRVPMDAMTPRPLTLASFTTRPRLRSPVPAMKGMVRDLLGLR